MPILHIFTVLVPLDVFEATIGALASSKYIIRLMSDIKENKGPLAEIKCFKILSLHMAAFNPFLFHFTEKDV